MPRIPVSQFSGPRMRSGAYYSKKYPGRPKKYVVKGKGLNKKEKKQVQKIIDKNVETKFFNTTAAQNVDELLPWPIQTNSNMYAIAFTTGGVEDDFPYGTSNSAELNICRVVTEAGTTSDYTLEGQECKPLMAKTRFFIEALNVNIEDAGQQVRDCLPTLVRMLHLRVKQTQDDTEPKPEDDAFLDQNNQPYGINISGFTKTDLVNCRPNTRRYNVIQDKMWMMAPPLTRNELDIGSGTEQPRNLNTSTSKKLITAYHKPCNKNRKLFYKEGETKPYSNENLEYVLFHFQHLGDNGTVRASADDFRITAYPTSSFKDA